jgi:ABC-type nitrate/sulfonate/bicarbonate transport system substrate-binding protein
MSLADHNPIAKPEDMYGKKIGVQSVNEPVWNAFIKAAGLDASKITKVPAQFDPQPLVNKEVDGWFSFVTNEPNLLKVKGVDTVTFLLNDHGYPMVSEILVVRKESLDKDRDKLKAVLRADLKGWRDQYKDPTASPKLVVEKYGKDLGLDEAEQTLESKAENELIFTSDTKTNGLFTLTDALIAETIKTLGVAGISMTAEKLFDMSVLTEVLKDDPSLKSLS